MGFDCYGESPKNKTGEYFRNNCWWWRPLWAITCELCPDILTEHDMMEGSWNNGHKISNKKCIAIAGILKAYISTGKAKEKEEESKAQPEKIICPKCEGKGEIGTVNTKKCPECKGEKEKANPDKFYPFSEENVKEFIEFLENCGGFTIC